MPVRKKPVLVKGPEFAAIRAYRVESREDQFRRQLAFLGVKHRPAHQLAEALRAERRGARSGNDYDLSRHFALVRLLRRANREGSRPG